ncbi:MAG: hypothetical protein AAFX65_04815 [Cyanobacteria bacterium J06638_7]
MPQLFPPVPPIADAASPQWHLLLAAAGDLSGDGQLRELIRERRQCQGGTGAIWYLPPRLVAELGLGEGLEALVTATPAVLTWLQLRFGGRASQVRLAAAWLDAEAGALPPGAPLPCLR